ncbi:flagellar M-ring protein FliF [uncultured Desulfovibrio sp.]|uniref:flagellar M-ring protein FliF n=1 Tax=uncultured Desulfovibrio sp. TaxID=167968 RepID=UPI0028065601|nr:flagellar M-ring protein FliF [uncultured Desulfovibrio sp.]
MKQEPKVRALSGGSKGGPQPPALADLRAIRLAQKATSQRVEELKLRVFRMTEQHMDQAVSLIRRWLKDEDL